MPSPDYLRLQDIASNLTSIHESLGLQPSVQTKELFFFHAYRHLQDIKHSMEAGLSRLEFRNPQVPKPVKVAVSFLLANGKHIWPADPRDRGHLDDTWEYVGDSFVRKDYVWNEAIVLKCGRLRDSATGRAPDDKTRELTVRLRNYFEIVMKLDEDDVSALVAPELRAQFEEHRVRNFFKVRLGEVRFNEVVW